jgi:hypothetical protein
MMRNSMSPESLSPSGDVAPLVVAMSMLNDWKGSIASGTRAKLPLPLELISISSSVPSTVSRKS